MENKKEIDIIAIFKHLWQKRKRITLWIVNGIIAGVIVAYSIPKEYQCQVILAPESRDNNSGANQMGGIAAMMGINIGSDKSGISESVYPTIIKSSPFLNEFAQMSIVYKEEQMTLCKYLLDEQRRPWWNYIFSAPSIVMGWFSKTQEEKPFDQFRPTGKQKAFEAILSSKIVLTSDKKNGTLLASVSMQNPEIAAIVADSLIVKLQKYMIDYYTEKNSGNLTYTQTMCEQAKVHYFTADSLYAITADRNQNLILKSAQIQLERLRNERDLAFTIYQQIASQVELARLKLNEDTPIVTIIEPARVPIEKSEPNRKTIIIAFLFLFSFSYCAVLTIKFIIK